MINLKDIPKIELPKKIDLDAKIPIKHGESYYCPKCAKRLQDDGRYCSYCGQKVRIENEYRSA